MSYYRYLTAINTSLREAVLPDVSSGRARDAVNNVISTVAAIAAQLELASPAAFGHLDVALLPQALQALVPAEGATAVTLARTGPPDDIAVSNETLPLLKEGAAWLSVQAWPGNAALKPAALALLSWESALRQDALARVATAEAGFVAQAGPAGAPDLTAAAIEAYLQDRYAAPQLRVTAFKFLSGGRNRQTALFEVGGSDAVPARLVIQREPAQQMTTLSGVGMQFALLSALYEAGMKVARPVLVELSPAALGGPFTITEQVSGSSPVPSMDYWCEPPKSDRLAASLAEQFACMHSVPIGALETMLQRYVDPAKGETWLSDINTLEQQWLAAAKAPSLAVTASLAWMRAHVSCVDAVETIVHNDALLHNVLAEGDEITAVLDFEMAHIGHPFEDLGYVRPVVERMTAWDSFVDAYVAAGGRRPTQEQVDFFTLRSILKLLIQVLYVRNAFDAGHVNAGALAEIGASFLPKLIARLSVQLNRILQVPG